MLEKCIKILQNEKELEISFRSSAYLAKEILDSINNRLKVNRNYCIVMHQICVKYLTQICVTRLQPKQRNMFAFSIFEFDCHWHKFFLKICI